jgi:hypothetical protein
VVIAIAEHRTRLSVARNSIDRLIYKGFLEVEKQLRFPVGYKQQMHATAQSLPVCLQEQLSTHDNRCKILTQLWL